jgi:hypothetical protein
MTYDISKMHTVNTEIELSRYLRKLQWSDTEKLFNRNAYYSGKGNSRKLIGITVFQPNLGPCECTHYVLCC